MCKEANVAYLHNCSINSVSCRTLKTRQFFKLVDDLKLIKRADGKEAKLSLKRLELIKKLSQRVKKHVFSDTQKINGKPSKSSNPKNAVAFLGINQATSSTLCKDAQD